MHVPRSSFYSLPKDLICWRSSGSSSVFFSRTAITAVLLECFAQSHVSPLVQFRTYSELRGGRNGGRMDGEDKKIEEIIK